MSDLSPRPGLPGLARLPMLLVRSLHDKGFFHLLSVNMLTQGLGFGTVLLVAKFLTPTALGEVRILQSYGAVLIVLAGFGYNAGVLKLCSEGRPEAENRAILNASLRRALVATAVAFAGYAVLTLTGVLASSPRLGRWMLVYATLVPFAVTTQILMGYLQARKRFQAMARTQAWIEIQAFVAVIVCTWLWGFAGFVVATIAGYVAGLIPLLPEVRVARSVRQAGPPPKSLAHLAHWSVLANGISIVGQYADMFLLDHFAIDRQGIGFYSLATIFVLGSMQVTATVQSIATPYFSERARNGAWFRSQLIRQQRRTALLSVVVAAAVLAGAWVLVPLVYGPAYRVTLHYLPILLLRYVLWSSYAVLGVGLFGLGLVRYNVLATAVTTPIGIGVSYLLLERYGIVGLAWGQVATAACMLTLQSSQVWFALRYRLRSLRPDAADTPA